jgi:hypothetical protein
MSQEKPTRRDQVVHLDERLAGSGAVLEAVPAHAEVQHQVRRDVPDVFQVEGIGLGLEGAARLAVARAQHFGDAAGT